MQHEKALVRAFHHAIEGAAPDEVGAVLARFAAPGWRWRGCIRSAN